MNHPRSPRTALLRSLLGSLLLTLPAFAVTPADFAALQAKAEKGNAIAQYNLGLAYADRNTPAYYDPVQAYVWLNLAADNGATGKALETLTATMTPSQLAEGKNRLAANRPSASLADSPISAASPILPVQDSTADTGKIEADKKQLSDEIASSWKENDRLKSLLSDANKRLAIAGTALVNKDREIASLQASLATPAAPVINPAELNALSRERDQLRAAFTKADADRIALQSKIAEANKDLVAAQKAQRLAESETASLKSAADKAGSDRLAIAAQLENANSEAARLRAELEAAKSAATAESPALADLRDKLAASEKTLADTKAELAALKSAGGGLSPTGIAVLKADRDHLADSMTELAKERDTLAQQLAAAKTAAPAPAPAVAADTEVTTARLANLEKAKAEADAKLDAALRTYTLNQAEIDRLQKALANIDDERAGLSDKLADAKKELAAIRPQAEAAASSADQIVALGNQLADTKRALAERTAALDHAVQDLASVRQVADTVTSDLAATREQLRQTQAQAAASANEALNLKTRLALAASAPVTPSRPGTIVPTSIPPDRPLYTAAPATPPAPEPATAATTVTTPPRTYVVTSGDSLYTIAKRFYGSASRWTEILAANRDVITNPNALALGTTLRIP